MFNRKVVVVALMAVVLLTSLSDGGETKAREFKHKRRAAVTGDISMVYPAGSQASLKAVMDPFASGITAAEASDSQTILVSRGKPRRPGKRL